MGADEDFEIVDGLAQQRERYGIGFADTVRIRSIPETDRSGFAGRVGQVFGETVPSSGAIEGERLIGEPEEDFALYVDFGEHGGAWFAPHLVEFVERPLSVEWEVDAGEPGGRDTGEQPNARSGFLRRWFGMRRGGA